MNEILLQAKEIRKTFRQPTTVEILQGVNLTVRRGEAVAIMGRSGEGKSTLLNILGTLDKPCSGAVEILGKEVSTFNRTTVRNKNLAFIFQSFHLLEDFTALENILMPAMIGRKGTEKGGEMHSRALNLLNHVGLFNRAHFYSKQLSGGEKQRIAIARALCNDPDILLADEPSGNLDSDNAAQIQEILLSYAHDHKKGLIIVTHDHNLARACDSIYELKAGQLCLVER